jgi:hypothetical protein
VRLGKLRRPLERLGHQQIEVRLLQPARLEA